MLNKQQIEIADFLLKYLDSKGGKSSLDDYPEKFQKQGFDHFDSHSLVKILIQELGLLTHPGNSDHWIMLTSEGTRVAKIGIEKYFEEIEQDKQLDRDSKKANIEGITKANKNSKRAIIIAVFIPILIAAIQIYFDNRKNSVAYGNNDGGDRPEVNHSQFPFNRADTLLIEEIKNSLKHDTVFINEVKQLIDNKKK